MTKYYAHYDEAGQIIGMYNTDDHKSIPEPAIEITLKERNSIVRTPTNYYIADKKLFKNEEKLKEQEEKLKSYRKALNDYKTAINKGFLYRGVLYSASDEASAHVTQCLAIATHEEKFVPQLYVLDGLASRKPVTSVSKESLVQIAEGINRLRQEARLTLYKRTRKGI